MISAWRDVAVHQHWDRLVALNRSGHGIYVMVNAGDGRGRGKANVVGLRAVFIDDDGKGDEPVAYGDDGHPFHGAGAVPGHG